MLRKTLLVLVALLPLLASADIRRSRDIYASAYGPRTSVTLNSILTNVATADSRIVADAGWWSITNDVTFPSNVVVQVPPGCGFDVTNGVTLTVNGGFEAGFYNIFAGSGIVTGAATYIYRPTQWGAAGYDIGDADLPIEPSQWYWENGGPILTTNSLVDEGGLVLSTNQYWENDGPVLTTNSLVNNGGPVLTTNFSWTMAPGTTNTFDTIVASNLFLGASSLNDLLASVAALAVPAGTIIAHGGTNDPTGYLYCDGTAVSRTTYSNLYAAVGFSYGHGDASTTFNVPDLRGMFLRGLDGAAGRDPDEAARVALFAGGNTGTNVGSYQAEEILSHTHTVEADGSYAGYSLSDGDFSPANDESKATSAYGGNETRPENVYVRYFIKY